MFEVHFLVGVEFSCHSDAGDVGCLGGDGLWGECMLTEPSSLRSGVAKDEVWSFGDFGLDGMS